MAAGVPDVVGEGYHHEAFFYADDDEFMDGTLGFIRDAVDADEPILVVLAVDRIAALRGELDAATALVQFIDMAAVGTNPARIIPAWQDFLTEHAVPDRRVRGIGEPIWAQRSPAELAECQRHEALLNIAFPNPDFWLRCPYDTRTLDDSVIEEACRTHPFVCDGDAATHRSTYPGDGAIARPFDRPLDEPAAAPAVLSFQHETLRDVRALVETCASRAGLGEVSTAELVLAVYEISTNSIRHGGGRGTLRVWIDNGDVVCEVRDAGRMTDPMLGRVRPSIDANRGRGLWLANQLCDLVELRAFPNETVTRLHMRVG